MIAYFCAEDTLSGAVGQRLLSVHPKAHLQELLPRQGGNSAIRARFGNYCQLAAHHPTLILTDLDAMPCAPELRRDWVMSAHVHEPLPAKMAFCIAVREVETWLMADTKNFADFIGVAATSLGSEPETLPDPKQRVVQLARDSRKKVVREGIPPPRGSRAKVGLEYNPILVKFVRNEWRPDVAAANSASLTRALERIASLAV